MNSSHLWEFSWGIGIGLLVAIAWSALHSASHNLPNNVKHLENMPASSETTSEQDLSSESSRSFLFDID